MDPYTFAALTAFQLYSGFQEAALIDQNARLQAEINEINAEQAELDAWEAEKDGYSEVARYATIVDSTISSQRVAFAGDNVDVSFGTAKQIQTQTKLVGELNALDIQEAAHNRALGFKREASNIRLGATMQEAQSAIEARGAQVRGITGAARTTLSGYEAGAFDDLFGKSKPKSPSGKSITGA